MYDITIHELTLHQGAIAVGMFASATMGLYVVRRVWKIIRASI